MSQDLRARDPLVEGCASLGSRFGVSEPLGPALETWMAPAFEGLEPAFTAARDRVLLAACARLADIGARLHPDHRASLAFDQVLRAPIAGQTHAERAFIATAIHTRYEPDLALLPTVVVDRVLTPERLHRARAVGLALRLGCDVSGRSAALLAASRLCFTNTSVLLTAEPQWADLLLGEQSRKRLNALAAHLELGAEARPED